MRVNYLRFQSTFAF